MNFPESLSTAARLEPSIKLHCGADACTQDDIDALAAVFGWSFEVTCYNRTDGHWDWEAWSLGGAVSLKDDAERDIITSKPEASKAAFIAIIQQVEKERV